MTRMHAINMQHCRCWAIARIGIAGFLLHFLSDIIALEQKIMQTKDVHGYDQIRLPKRNMGMLKIVLEVQIMLLRFE